MFIKPPRRTLWVHGKRLVLRERPITYIQARKAGHRAIGVVTDRDIVEIEQINRLVRMSD